MDLRTSVDIVGDNRGWLWGPHGTEPGTNPSIDLDVSLFSADQTKGGYIPSGTVLGQVTDGKYGPYDPAATDGRETAVGILFSSVGAAGGQATTPNQAMLIHGFVDASRLPFQTGPGSLDEAAKGHLPHIITR